MSAVTIMPLGLMGCGGDDDDDDDPVDIPTPTPPSSATTVEFQATIDNYSRNTDTNFENGDEISVWAMESYSGTRAELVPSRSYANNKRYTYNSSRFTATPANAISKDDDVRLNYYAVYPYSMLNSNNFSFSVETDQSVIENYNASDLCLARTSVVSSPLVDLNFVHALSQIIINVDASIGTVSSIVLTNVKQNVIIDLNDWLVESYGVTGNIRMLPYGTRSFKAVVPIMSVSAGMQLAVIHSSKGDFYWTISQNIDFSSGMSYSFTLSPSSSDSSVSFTGEITPWIQK